MERRDLFTHLAAGLLGSAAIPKPASGPEKPPGYDSLQRALCRIYRINNDVITGSPWTEITIADLCVGDRIIMIGQNDGHLFMAGAATITKLHGPAEWNGHTAGYEATDQVSLI